MRPFRIIAVAAVAALAVPGVAHADRPGTPNGEGAGQCNLQLSEPPMVCVSFNNTATEPVTFDIEFTVDGVKIDKAYDPTHGGRAGERPHAVTFDRPFNYPKSGCVGAGCIPRQHYANHSSEAVDAFNGHHSVAEARTGDRNDQGMAIPPQGFRLVNVDYGVTYCFRFKARRASDGMVSEVWSNWACATTGGPPPKPISPEFVTAEYTKGGIDWREKPPKVVVRWGRGENVGDYMIGEEKYPPAVHEAIITLHDGSWTENIDNPSLTFKVCSVNVSGSACRSATTYRPPGDSVQPRHDATEMTLPNKGQSDARRPGADAMSPRAGGGFGTEMSTSAAQTGGGSNACASGYVWRVARGEDQVCVTPAARSRVAQENADAPSHVDPGGAYGPSSCAAGYVWRDAYRGDAVCVTPEARAIAHQENVEGPGHRADGGDVEFRDPR